MTTAANPDLLTTDSGTSRSLTGHRLGRYEVLCELATGGMATVYIARAQGVAGFERLVALKVLHPHLAYEEEFISMFLDEARLAARIRHPNVVATQDISDTEGDGFFLVMDYVEGDHLGSLLGRGARKGMRLPQPITSRLLIDALLGLSAAHVLKGEDGEPLNIVHRDISPHNILVGTDGVGRLTDFGVAKAEVRMSSTRAGQFKGKLSYMAPEQASTGNCDQRSDLFAMGIILWESLTARRLFRGESNAATLSKILVDPIPLPSEVSPELQPWDAVLGKALARNPDERFQTADEFAQAIEEAAAHNGGIATARAVGVLVRELVGDKVETEQRRVKSAITTNNASGGTQTRIPIAGSASRIAIPISHSNPAIVAPSSRPSIPFSPTHSGVVARTAPLPGESSQGNPVVVVQDVSNRTTMLLVVALVLVAAMAGVAGFFASRGQPQPQQVIVNAPPVAATVPAAPLAPPAAPPAAAVAVTETVVAPPAVEPPQADEARESSGSRRRGARASSAATTTPPTTQTVTTPPPAMVEHRDENPEPNPYTGI